MQSLFDPPQVRYRKTYATSDLRYGHDAHNHDHSMLCGSDGDVQTVSYQLAAFLRLSRLSERRVLLQWHYYRDSGLHVDIYHVHL